MHSTLLHSAPPSDESAKLADSSKLRKMTAQRGAWLHLQTASLGHFICSCAFIVNVHLELHTVSCINLHALDNIAHVHKENILLVHIVLALLLLGNCSLGFHHIF